MRIFILLFFLVGSSTLWGQNGSIVLEHLSHNVLYIGISNPIDIAVRGVPAQDIYIKIKEDAGLRANRSAESHYDIFATKLTPRGSFAYIDIYQRSTNKFLARKAFQVKRIPDPVVQLSNGRVDGLISAAELGIQTGLMIKQPNFNYDAPCKVQSFTLYYSKTGQDPIEFTNRGARFEPEVLAVIQNAQAGDSFQIINVKGRCPDHRCGRKLNGLAFQVR